MARYTLTPSIHSMKETVRRRLTVTSSLEEIFMDQLRNGEVLGEECVTPPAPTSFTSRARICKILKSPGIDSKGSIPPACRVGVTNRVIVPVRQAT